MPTSAGLLQLGHSAPGFRLPEPLTGRLLGPEDYPDAAALAVVFLANRCPEVQHIAGALARVARDHAPERLQVLGVNAMDDDADPEESPAAVAAEALKRGYVFPYLSDQSQAVARVFGAERTPDVFLFDRGRRLVYHGRFDASGSGGGKPASGRDLRHALEAVLSGAAPGGDQAPSRGSPIRWRDAPRRSAVPLRAAPPDSPRA
jgi:hypothetical protein